MSAPNNVFKNLPPEVKRELLRHVKPLGSSSSSSRHSAASGQSSSSNNTNNNRFRRGKHQENATRNWLIGCTLFVGAAGSLPYWATKSIGSLTDRDEVLNPSAVRRGAFSNSGTKDAGRDPHWDWKNGRYIYPPGFAEHLKKQDPNETDLGPDIGPMVVSESKKKNSNIK